ncbi:MAG TPA: glycosyltransferase, partial [Sphingomonas sp.]
AHWSYSIPALIDGWINVHTVHDVIPLERPDLSPIDAAAQRRRLLAIARATDRIVTVSVDAARRIEAAIGVEAVDLGGAVLGLEPDDADLPAGLTPGRFLLFCGLVEPRKNLAALARAWDAAGRPLPLVVAGPDGADGAALRRALAAAGAITLPFQPRPRLARLIRDARALVFPSLAEGFGLPVAEAMTLGTPVITSSGGAPEEVAGGAALLVDPRDEAALADAIRLIAADDALAARLRSAGLARAERFGVDAFGRRLLRFYDGLVAERGGRA